MTAEPVMRADDSPIEGLDAFRQRARTWIRANVELATEPVWDIRGDIPDHEELTVVARHRELQRRMFDAGLAGICVPREYGGQGLTAEHQRVLNEEMAGHDFALRLQIPTMSPCAAVILEFGTHEQKLRHIPPILRGEQIWVQFLSEPSGGSDVAGALTTAVRDGDEWVLNGSKVWSSGAWWSDWALCLARTNWDVPKHRGLSVFMFPVNSPGVEVQRIEMLSGLREFCQEFLTDVRVPDSHRLGDVDQGWTVGRRWMVHERMSMASPMCTIPVGWSRRGDDGSRPVALLEKMGVSDDPRALDLAGESRMLEIVHDQLHRRLATAFAIGTAHPEAPAISRLWDGIAYTRQATITLELAGSIGGVWADEDPAARVGTGFLVSQMSCIGGGTTEIARNVIAERILGMPREPALDRDIPFRDVSRRSSSRP